MNKRIGKKLTAMLLALALCCSMAPFAFAEKTVTTGDEDDWETVLGLSDGEVTVDGNTVTVHKPVALTEAIQITSGTYVLNFEGGLTATDTDRILEISGSDTNVTIAGGEITGKNPADNTQTAAIKVDDGAKLTVQGGTISTANSAIYVTGTGSSLKVTGGDIKGGQENVPGKNYPAVYVEDTSGSTPETPNFTMTGGSITSEHSTAISAGKNANVQIDNGTVTSNAFRAVDTNGAASTGAKIVVNGGTLKGGASNAAIYMPNGSLTVNNGTITGGAGIVARGGNVEMKGGTVTATASGNVKVGDGDAEVKAAGIVIEPSGGGYPEGFDVTVTGGTVQGQNGADALNVDADGAATVTPSISGGNFNGSIKDNSGNNTLHDKITGGSFTDPNVKGYTPSDSTVVGVGNTYSVGEQARQALSGAKPGDTVTVVQAAANADLSGVPDGVTVNNNSGVDVSINGQTIRNGGVYFKPQPQPAAPEDDGTEYIVCEACGYHFWEPYLDGWRCTTCGHLRGTTGVPAAASGAPRSPQTGLWWLLG